ncbi:DUF4352 domain-containing protein [Campylobacter sp. MG1]|uniref:DUF4352 domain-containing protein n=1 Tax=Campylobacter sp. MG1 TaxID=2976332 RepID=UPI002D1E4804|nr:DUF4352 domain-containing protein [Campylobacter sp. MG1]
MKNEKFFKFIFVTIIVIIVLGIIFAGENTPNAKDSNIIKIGETLNTSKFAITVHSVKIARNVNTSNFLTNLDAEQGVLYLIIDATFKNISKESRMLLDGDVLIVSKDNGEALKYEVSEVIMQDDWGIFLEPMNPGLTKKN